MDSLEHLANRVAEMDVRLGEWQSRVNAEFAKLWDVNSREPDKWTRKLKWAAEEARRIVGAGPEDEYFILVDEICTEFSIADAVGRNRIRAMFTDTAAIGHALYGYIGRCRNLLTETGERIWLRRGLAAAAIEDQQTDFRDLYVGLGELYKAAEQVGIDPLPYFAEAAKLASDVPTAAGAGRSTRDFLAGFHTSLYFKSSVKPEAKRRKTTPSAD